MKTKFKHLFNLFMLALVAMVGITSFTSCSDNDDEPSANAVTSGNEVSFNITTGNAIATRGTAVNSTNISDMKNFGVVVINDSTNAAYAGSSLLYLVNGSSNGYLVRNGETSTNFYNGGSMLWPDVSAPLSFYALSPAPFTAINQETYKTYCGGNTRPTVNGNTLTFQLPNDTASQRDIMYARALHQTKKTNKGSVNLQFRHLLSQINVSVGTNKYYKVAVSSVTLQGNYAGMSIDMLTGATSRPSSISATNTYSFGRAQEFTNDTIKLNPSPIFVTPFFKDAWNPAIDGPASIGGNIASYLAVVCKIVRISDNSVMYNGVIFIPFKTKVEAGKVYNIILGFNMRGNDGYDENGDPINSYIHYSVSAENWPKAINDGHTI